MPIDAGENKESLAEIYSSVMDRLIEFPIHGCSRSIERKIERKEIADALNDHNAVVIQQPNQRFRLMAKGLSVILEYRNDTFRVVTVFRNGS